MNKQTYKVLVPYDFTAVADCAVSHAVQVAQPYGGEVHLLHVVAKESEIDSAKEKLDKIVREIKTNDVTIHSIVKVGNIFKDIGSIASDISAVYIVMGTHGSKGMQKIMGSHAIKVISHSKVPFIIVQEKKPLLNTGGYTNIVVPINHSDVTKERLNIAVSIAKQFKSKILLFADYESDEFLKRKLDQELIFAKKFFADKGLSYEIERAKDGEGAFKKQLINYSVNINADLIVIVNTQQGAFLPDFLGSDEQEVITNDAQIPVLIANPSRKFIPTSFSGAY